jgi:cysteine desulfurase/selenocysteine lyase
MNTNKPTPVDELDLTGASQAMSEGLPDPAALARLACDLYREFQQAPAPATSAIPAAPPDGRVPSTTEVAEAPVSGLRPPAIPVMTEPLTEAGLQQAASEISGEIGGMSAPISHPPANAPSTWAEWASPAIPGRIPATGVSMTPSFSFIEEARSLFEKTAGRPSLQEAAIPAPNTASILAAPVEAFSTPQIPGSVTRFGAIDQSPAFDFLEAARPVSSLNDLDAKSVASVTSPAGNDPVLSSQPRFSTGFFDVLAVRRDFPTLQEQVHGRPLIWLDNAATTQKPRSVIDRLSYYYEHENSNVHRAAHEMAARSTDAYDAAREKVRRFLNAGSAREIVFVRGATEGVNLVANSWGRQYVRQGDEIVITHLEHHANIVPWQMLCAEKGARLRVVPVDDSGQVLLDEYEKLLGPKTRLVAFAHVSNALGTVLPVAEMVAMAHRYGAKALIDGAQAVSHMSVDVQAYDCDFYVFSGHKVFAPTGIGVVYGKQEILDSTPPWQGGGNMIADVTFDKTLYQAAPARFEAGTPSVADAVGLGEAIDYLDRLGMANVSRYEHGLLAYALEGLQRIPGLRLIGTAREKASVLSFALEGFTAEEVGQALNLEGIAVRAGHHCAQPILRRFGLESSVRPSLALYNTRDECDALIAAIWNLKSGRNPGLV